MYTQGLALFSLMALSAIAAPTNPYQRPNSTISARGDADTFNIHLYNNCAFPKEFALYQITSSFEMLQRSTPVTLKSKGHKVIPAPFKDSGMRLSGHAELGTAGQWKSQALFEFGYSEYAGQTGTAYDLSVMTGSDKDIGIGAYPIGNGKGSASCESKTCFPWSCPSAQGWTDPNQLDVGSPADTVCYKGKTDFKVVFCP